MTRTSRVLPGLQHQAAAAAMVDLHHDPVRWEQHIRGHMADYTRCSTHAASAQRLKSLVKSQWLDYADMKARPEVCVTSDGWSNGGRRRRNHGNRSWMKDGWMPPGGGSCPIGGYPSALGEPRAHDAHAPMPRPGIPILLPAPRYENPGCNIVSIGILDPINPER